MLVSGDGEGSSVAVSASASVSTKMTKEANLSAADALRMSLRKRALPAVEGAAANEVKDLATEAEGGMAVDSKAAADESAQGDEQQEGGGGAEGVEGKEGREGREGREGPEVGSPQKAAGGEKKKKKRGGEAEAGEETSGESAGLASWTADYDVSLTLADSGAGDEAEQGGAAMDQGNAQEGAAEAEAEEAEDEEEEWVDATVKSEVKVAEVAAAKAMKLDHARHELTVRLRQRTDETLDEMKRRAIVDEVKLHESGWKDRYYQAKYKKEDVQMGGGLRNMCHTYIQGLCWVFSYYYRGCPSWSWYFPFHYAPFASDLRNIDTYPIDFDQAQPFRPIEQLLAVLPKESAHALPEPCRWLMTAKDSPIADLYVGDVALDPNGKALPWLWILLLPFIKEQRIQDAYNYCKDRLSLEDRRRNAFGRPLIFLARQHPLAAALVDRLRYACGKEKDEEVVRALKASGARDGADAEGAGKAASGAAAEAAEEEESVLFDAQAGAGISGLLSAPPPQYYAEVGAVVPGPGEPAGHFKDIASNQVMCFTYELPEEAFHSSSLLPGARPDPPTLTEHDVNRPIPRAARGRFNMVELARNVQRNGGQGGQGGQGGGYYGGSQGQGQGGGGGYGQGGQGQGQGGYGRGGAEQQYYQQQQQFQQQHATHQPQYPPHAQQLGGGQFHFHAQGHVGHAPWQGGQGGQGGGFAGARGYAPPVQQATYPFQHHQQNQHHQHHQQHQQHQQHQPQQQQLYQQQTYGYQQQPPPPPQQSQRPPYTAAPPQQYAQHQQQQQQQQHRAPAPFSHRPSQQAYPATHQPLPGHQHRGGAASAGLGGLLGLPPPPVAPPATMQSMREQLARTLQQQGKL